MGHSRNINNRNEPARFTDHDLLKNTKDLVRDERHLLSQILKNLKEVERRKLFSDLGYKSLFEYAVKELGYSEGQAGRRIQAMRLINEIPEIEEKIENGSLSLSNISQAQSFFREMRKMKSQRQMELNDRLEPKELDLFGVVDKTSFSKEDEKMDRFDLAKGRDLFDELGSSNESEKMASSDGSRNLEVLDKSARIDKVSILRKLENKSTREAEKILLELNPKAPKLKETERALSNELTEVRFVITEDLKKRLEELRSLLGSKGSSLSFSELIGEMTDIGIEALRKKKFGSRNSRILKATSRDLARLKGKVQSPKQLKSNPLESGMSDSELQDPGKQRFSLRDPKRQEFDLKESKTSKASSRDLNDLNSVPQNLRKVSRKIERALIENSIPTPAPELSQQTELSKGNYPNKAHSSSSNGKSLKTSPRTRYIPKSIKTKIWIRDKGRCQICRSKQNINFDHIHPYALGGESTESNLRLLCHNCNQRQAIKSFGLKIIEIQRRF